MKRLWRNAGPYLVIEVNEHGEWDDSKYNESSPVVVVDGIVRVSSKFSNSYLKKTDIKSVSWHRQNFVRVCKKVWWKWWQYLKIVLWGPFKKYVLNFWTILDPSLPPCVIMCYFLIPHLGGYVLNSKNPHIDGQKML